tara:strand:+ start:3936 stop:5900 length:1965 start_codon:yes stop_codon:yes gene_type:complete
MITYNGIELDYRADTLQSLIIKGGLTKIDNLTDRTGTSSTQFNLPRTAKNELAFGNITTEGSELTTSGSAFITLEGNVFSQGVLYVQGYDQDNFKCLFMGANNDVIGRLKAKPLKNLIDTNNRFALTDATIRSMLSTFFVPGATLGEDIQFHFGSGFLRSLSDAGTLNKDTVAPFFTVRSMLHKMFKDEGYDLVSNFFNSDFGAAIDYSNFGSADDILSNNSYSGGTNVFPSGSGSNYGHGFGLGTPASGNNSINVITPTPNLGFINNGDAYQIVNDCDTIKLSGVFEYQGNEHIQSVQIIIIIYNPIYPNSIVFASNEIENTSGLLQEGTNYFETEISATFLATHEINIIARVNGGGGTSDYTGASLTCTEFNISNNNRVVNDTVWIGDYIGGQNQLEFLKGVLNDLNLVLDIDGTTAYIELQDEGTEPVGSSPATLPSIATSQYDLTDIAQESTSTNIEYLQADLIHLNQQINETDYVKSIGVFKYQDFGSFYYKLNSFNNSRVEKIDSFFKAYYDGSSFIEKVDSFNGTGNAGAYSETWENNLSCRYRYQDAGFNGADTFTYTNADASTTSVTGYINWSLPVAFAKTWNKLFINTLNQKKNNKIIEVVFRDELGTIVNNRTEYIFNNQVYKIVEWNYDIIKKLVKAKLIMK